MKPALRLAALSSLAGLSLLASAAAQDRQWISDEGDWGAHLIYGTPNSDDVIIGFGCNRDSSELRITHVFAAEGLEAGDSVELVLAAGDTRYSMTGTAFDGPLGEVEGVGAVTVFDSNLIALLGGEGDLEIMAGESTTSVPLQGAAEGLDRLARHCGA